MKKTAAIISFAIASSNVVYWIVFWNKNEKLAKSNHNEFIDKYISSFPLFLQSLFPVYATLICFLLFLFSGIVFLRQNKIVYKVLAIVSFILSAWMIFSLM